jgi:hypothetical protein
MSETAMNMEPPKKGLKEGLRRAFTVSGAKEKWYQDHKEMVAKYADVHNGLTDEQRSAVMAQIESDATKSAKIAVGKRTGALALTSAVVGTAGLLIAKPDLARRFMEWTPKILGNELSTGKVGKAVFTGADKAHSFLAEVWTRAGSLKEAALARGKALFTKTPPAA